MTTLQQPAPTFDDVWRTIQELALLSKENERLMKESAAETERLMKESAAENERQIKESLAETERFLKERAAETEKMFKNVSKKLGDLGNRLGEFVEHSVAPAALRLFQAEGIEVHEVHSSVEAKRNDEAIEIDLLVVNDGALVVIECKSKLTIDHVDEHVKRMEKLKRLLPLYKNHQAYGAVAAMVISDSVKNYAHKHGFYVLYQNGDNIDVSHPATFKPRTW
jgi:hypothetical protein